MGRLDIVVADAAITATTGGNSGALKEALEVPPSTRSPEQDQSDRPRDRDRRPETHSHSAICAVELVKEARPLGRYRGPVRSQRVPGGVVHKLPADLRRALIANPTALDAWKDITPLARNEFICWVEDAKQGTTRERRIRRTQEELEEGQRRPCCWPGCKHRDRTGT